MMDELDIDTVDDVMGFILDGATEVAVKVKCLSIISGLKRKDKLIEIIDLLRNRSIDLHPIFLARFVSEFGSKSATRNLMQIAVFTPYSDVRDAALYALWELADDRARCTFRYILSSVKYDCKLRGKVAEYLGMVEKTSQFLFKYVADPCPDVRCGALYGIAVIEPDLYMSERFRFLLLDDAETTTGEKVSELASRVLLN